MRFLTRRSESESSLQGKIIKLLSTGLFVERMSMVSLILVTPLAALSAILIISGWPGSMLQKSVSDMAVLIVAGATAVTTAIIGNCSRTMQDQIREIAKLPFVACSNPQQPMETVVRHGRTTISLSGKTPNQSSVIRMILKMAAADRPLTPEEYQEWYEYAERSGTSD